MLTFTQGEDLTITVPLLRDGEPFVADTGTIRWTLRGQDGTVLLANQTVSDDTDSSVQVVVPALQNGIAVGRDFEKRFVVVRGTVDGQAFIANAQYRLTPWLNHSVTCDDVRAFIGTDAGELPDAEIDLLTAYHEIRDLIGETPLTEALDSGTTLELTANNAIKGQAVLNALPGMQARMSKREEDGVMKVERFAIDFAALADQAKRLINRAARDVGQIDDAVTAPTLFVLATPATDEVTGSAPA